MLYSILPLRDFSCTIYKIIIIIIIIVSELMKTKCVRWKDVKCNTNSTQIFHILTGCMPGEGSRLRRLRIANEKQCIQFYSHTTTYQNGPQTQAIARYTLMIKHCTGDVWRCYYRGESEWSRTRHSRCQCVWSERWCMFTMDQFLVHNLTETRSSVKRVWGKPIPLSQELPYADIGPSFYGRYGARSCWEDSKSKKSWMRKDSRVI